MLQLTVINKIFQANNNITFELQPRDAQKIAFIPGQFITLVFEFGTREVRRAYSLHNAPDTLNLAITIKRVDNGEISRYMQDHIGIGDALSAIAPMGFMTYNTEQTSANKLWLFGAGVGITPLLAILRAALFFGKHQKIILVYSNHSPSTTLFFEELTALQKEHATILHIEWIFSNAKRLDKARLNRDYILQLVSDTTISSEINDSICYTCGPINYMDLVRYTLLGIGFENDHIKKETFVIEEEDDDENENTTYQDTNSYLTKFRYGNDYYEWLIPYNKSILDIALEHKLPLSYSCKSGMCGSCVATCISGNVRMAYNEVLTDNEVARGRVLLCTAHPTENDTTIQY